MGYARTRKRHLLRVFAILVLAAAAAQASSEPDPWPSYPAQQGALDYVGVSAVPYNGLWYYYLTVDLNATDPEYGAVTGVKALAVYLNAGEPVPKEYLPSDWTGYDTPNTRNGWFYGHGYEPAKGAFGYVTGAPTYYVPDDGNSYLIGAALFPSTFDPEEQLFLVHVVCESDGTVSTFWARPGKASAVPEPAGLLILVSLALPVIGSRMAGKTNKT